MGNHSSDKLTKEVVNLMNAPTPLNLLAAATIVRTPANSSDHELVIRQRPQAAKVFIGKEKDRKPIDPPPIIQLRIRESVDPNQNYLQSPYYFISCSLLDEDENRRSESEREEVKAALAGTLVSSLHRLKDTDNNDGGFFVFGDLSVKTEGIFRLQFTLYEVRDKEVEFIKSIRSDVFTVFASKNWPGMAESTFLTRSFSDQGVRLRLRKEPRFRLGPRGPASDDYQPRHYNRGQNQNQNQRPSPSDYSQVPQHSLNPQQGYVAAPRNVQGEYAPNFSNQTSNSPGSSMHDDLRKRNHSFSSHSGSYGSRSHDSSHHDSSHYGPLDEPSLKRMKSDASQHSVKSEGSEHSLYGQPYSLSSSQPFGVRQFAETPPVASFPSFSNQPQQTYGYSQNPQPPQTSQHYSTYSQSTQSANTESSTFVPRRLDTSFANQAVPLPYDSPIGDVRSVTSATSQTQLFQRSPASASAPTSTTSYGFAPPPQQPLYGMQHPAQMSHAQVLQQQYTPQLQQSIPQSRAVATSLGGIGMYQHDGGAEARPTMLGLSEMPPPMFGSSGRGMSLAASMGVDILPGMPTASPSMGMGMPHMGTSGGGAQLPSPSGSIIGGRGWAGSLDQYGRQREDQGR